MQPERICTTKNSHELLRKLHQIHQRMTHCSYHHAPFDIAFLSCYFEKQFLSITIMDIVARHFHKKDTIDGLPTVVDLALRDLSRVPYPIAAAAWLTTDGFRWHLMPDPLVSRTPEDLSYGLVLSYYEPVMQSSLLFLGYECPWTQKITEEQRAKAANFGKQQAALIAQKFIYPKDVTEDVLHAPTYSPMCPICSNRAHQH